MLEHYYSYVRFFFKEKISTLVSTCNSYNIHNTGNFGILRIVSEYCVFYHPDVIW